MRRRQGGRNGIWPPLLREAGLPAKCVHDLRHTYATLQLAAGTNPKLVAEVLGHKDVGITLDRYSHSQPAMHREAAERLDAMLGRTSGYGTPYCRRWAPERW